MTSPHSHANGSSRPATSFSTRAPGNNQGHPPSSLPPMQRIQGHTGHVRHRRGLGSMPNFNPFEGQRRALDPHNYHPNFCRNPLSNQPTFFPPQMVTGAPTMQVIQGLPGHAMAINRIYTAPPSYSFLGAPLIGINTVTQPTNFLVPASEGHLYNRHWTSSDLYRRDGYMTVASGPRSSFPSLAGNTTYLAAPHATASPPPPSPPLANSMPPIAVSPIFQRCPPPLPPSPATASPSPASSEAKYHGSEK